MLKAKRQNKTRNKIKHQPATQTFNEPRARKRNQQNSPSRVRTEKTAKKKAKLILKKLKKKSVVSNTISAKKINKRVLNKEPVIAKLDDSKEVESTTVRQELGSSSIRAKDAIVKIRLCKTLVELNSFINNETRLTVLRAFEIKKKQLKKQISKN